MVAGLAPAVALGDDLNAEANQRANVAGDEAVAADDVDHAPACGEADADLRHPRIAGPRRGVDPLTQRDLVGERDLGERILGAVHRLIGALRRGGRRAPRRVEQLERRGRSLDRGLADFIGVGEGGGFAGHAAKPEAGSAMIIGGLQSPIVEAEGLARAILKVELAIVAARQMLRREPPRRIRIEAAVEEVAGVGLVHAALLSAGPPSSTKRRSQ